MDPASTWDALAHGSHFPLTPYPPLVVRAPTQCRECVRARACRRAKVRKGVRPRLANKHHRVGVPG